MTLKRMIPLMVLFTMLFALCAPSVAYAQDAGPEETPAATEEAPVETPLATEEAPVVTEEIPAVTEEAPVETPAAPADPSQEASVTEVPTVTTVQFCKYDDATGTVSNCTDFSSIMGAVTAAYAASFDANVGAMIKLLAASYSEDVNVNGSSFMAAPTSFTLTGASTINGSVGVLNLAGSVNVTGGNGTLAINGPLYVGNIGGDVDLSHLDVSSPRGAGINIGYVDGNIVVDDVDSSDNNGVGLLISESGMGDAAPESAASPVYVPNNIIISNSTFEGNGSDGIVIESETPILIQNVTSVWNSGEGLYIDQPGYSDMMPADAAAMLHAESNVTISGSHFDNNEYNGMLVFSDGSVYIDHSSFNQNGSSGAKIGESGELTDVSPEYEASIMPYVDNVTLNQVTANGNQEGGVYISLLGDADVQNSVFNENGTAGLVIYTADDNGDSGPDLAGEFGSVNVRNVTASGNGWDVDEEYVGIGNGDGLIVYGLFSGINIENSTFNNNIAGLITFGYGPVTVKNVTANGNTAGMINISFNGDPINVVCSAFQNNSLGGLGVFTNGTLILNSVQSSGNGGPDEINASEVIQTSGPCGDETSVEEPGIVVRVYTDEEDGRSVTANGRQGIVFKLVRKLEDDQEEMIARMAFPASAVAGGVAANFKPVEAGAPAELEDGMTFVGPAFNLSLTAMDGTAIDKLNGYASLLFKLEDDYTVPAGQRLAVVHYDEEQAKWVELSTGVSGQYAYAFTTSAGAFALVTVPVE